MSHCQKCLLHVRTRHVYGDVGLFDEAWQEIVVEAELFVNKLDIISGLRQIFSICIYFLLFVPLVFGDTEKDQEAHGLGRRNSFLGEDVHHGERVRDHFGFPTRYSVALLRFSSN